MHRRLSSTCLAVFCGAALSTATLPAQFDFDLEKTSSARLGESLDLSVVGAPPASILLFVPSNTAGPTPLSLIDPNDLRALDVGTDLLGALSFTVTDGTGAAGLSLALPTAPSLAGIQLHWQSITLLLGATFFGELSNSVITLTGAPDTPVAAPSALAQARAFAASLIDADNNASAGDVLITGGGTGTLTSAVGLASTELWDYRRMRRLPGPTMTTARALHSAVRLDDGRVLLIGGADAGGVVLSSCEIYDPATNSFAATGSMGTPRILFGATKLTDGRVMVAGGTSTLMPDVVGAIGGTLNSAEIFNPATGTWSGTANIGGRRLAPALTALNGNAVLISGGVQVGLFLGIPISAASTTAAQVWVSGSWSGATSMNQARAGHQYNQVTLGDGRILMRPTRPCPSTSTSGSPHCVLNPEIRDLLRLLFPALRLRLDQLHVAVIGEQHGCRLVVALHENALLPPFVASSSSAVFERSSVTEAMVSMPLVVNMESAVRVYEISTGISA